MKRCPKCRTAKPKTEFYRHRSKPDGLTVWCKACSKSSTNRRQRTQEGKAKLRAYRTSPSGEAAHKKYRTSQRGREKMQEIVRRQRAKFPDRYRARIAVTVAIAAGRLPRPSTQRCRRCPQQAKEYHHYLGYAEEHRLDVEPLCPKCHRSADKLLKH